MLKAMSINKIMEFMLFRKYNHIMRLNNLLYNDIWLPHKFIKHIISLPGQLLRNLLFSIHSFELGLF